MRFSPFSNANRFFTSFINRYPCADTYSGQDRDTKCRSFFDFDRLDRLAIDIRLYLAPEQRLSPTATEPDRFYRSAQITEYLKGIAKAERDAFHYRSSQMCSCVARGQADKSGSSMRIEMRRTL